jgi:hypothetical protein
VQVCAPDVVVAAGWKSVGQAVSLSGNGDLTRALAKRLVTPQQMQLSNGAIAQGDFVEGCC